MTDLIRRTAETAVGYTLAAGAWAFAITTYPVAVACAIALAPSGRSLERSLAEHLERDQATKAARYPETGDQDDAAGPHDARAWTGVGCGA